MSEKTIVAGSGKVSVATRSKGALASTSSSRSRTVARMVPLISATRRVVSALRTAAEDYLRMRRALGYKLDVQGWMLSGFVAYLERVGASTVTIEHAVSWATEPAGADSSYWSDRLSVARQFGRYLQTIDPACEVPPTRLLPCRRRRAVPLPSTRPRRSRR
jgi:hypothetical protein